MTPKLINSVATLDEAIFERVSALLHTPIMIWVATNLVQLLYDGKVEKYLYFKFDPIFQSNPQIN